MILIDFSQIAIGDALAFGLKKGDVDLFRHIVFNSLRTYRVKFRKDYGDLIVCADGRRSWRKDYFPHYKANRGAGKEESDFDWDSMYEALGVVLAELKALQLYRVIHVDGAEGDDVIGWAVKAFPEENHVIVSSDRDFYQLHTDRVKQYSPMMKKFVKPKDGAFDYLIEHVAKGDRGDGIPNVVSDDTVFVDGRRQKNATKAVVADVACLMETPTHSSVVSDGFLRNFHRNRELIDLTRIPTEIEDRISSAFEVEPVRDRNVLLNFMIERKMKNLIACIDELF